MGYWQHARKEFQKTQRILKQDFDESEHHLVHKHIKDQLSENIMEYMESLNYEAPEDWEGYKQFDE